MAYSRMGSCYSCIKQKEPVEESLRESYCEYVNPIGSFRHLKSTHSVRFAPTVRVQVVQSS